MRWPILGLLVLTACGSSASKAPERVSPDPVTKPTAAPSAAVAPASSDLRWSIRRDCPLRYHLLSFKEEKLSQEGPPLSATVRVAVETVVTLVHPDEAPLMLRVEKRRAAILGSDWLSGSSSSPVWQDVAATGVGMELVNQGSRLTKEVTEVDDWAADPRGGQLSLLWPELPSPARRGASTTWRLPWAQPSVVEGDSPHATVRVDTKQGSVWVLAASWKETLAPTTVDVPLAGGRGNQSYSQRGHQEHQAVWRVSEDGRLLTAQITTDTSTRTVVPGRPVQLSDARVQLRAALVESCDGTKEAKPTLPGDIPEPVDMPQQVPGSQTTR